MRLPRLFFVLALAAPLAAAPALAQEAPAGRGPAAQVGPGARGAPGVRGGPGARGGRGGPGMHGGRGMHGGPGMQGGPGAHGGADTLTPEQRFERRYQHIVGSLGLDQAQAAQVRVILTEGRTQHEALASQRLTGEDARSRHRQIMEANGQRIRALLRPDQQRVFDFHAQRLREAGDRMEHGGGPGGAGGRGGMMHRAGGHIRQMLESLGLDETQRAAVRQIMQEGRTQHEAVRDQALTGEERHARHRQIMEANGQRIRTLLRPDQQRVFDERVAEMRARFQQFRGGAGGPGATPPATAPSGGI